MVEILIPLICISSIIVGAYFLRSGWQYEKKSITIIRDLLRQKDESMKLVKLEMSHLKADIVDLRFEMKDLKRKISSKGCQ